MYLIQLLELMQQNAQFSALYMSRRRQSRSVSIEPALFDKLTYFFAVIKSLWFSLRSAPPFFISLL